MIYRKLGNSELNVSAVGLGTWALGGDFWGQVDDRNSISAIQAGIDSGINLIDTAPAYGQDQHAEKIVGKAIKGRREKVIIATKVGTIRHPDSFERNLKPDNIIAQLEESLENLGVDVIDLYQIHWPDAKTPLEESLKTLAKAQKDGKFKYFGVANFNIEQLNQARDIIDVVSLQPPFSLLKRNIESDILPYCRKKNLGVLGYGALAGGILTGKFRDMPVFKEDDKRSDFYPYYKEPLWGNIQKLLDVLRKIAGLRSVPVAQVSINWAIHQSGITSSLVGAKTTEQAVLNAGAADFNLSESELEEIDNAYNKFLKKLL